MNSWLKGYNRKIRLPSIRKEITNTEKDLNLYKLCSPDYREIDKKSQCDKKIKNLQFKLFLLKKISKLTKLSFNQNEIQISIK